MRLRGGLKAHQKMKIPKLNKASNALMLNRYNIIDDKSFKEYEHPTKINCSDYTEPNGSIQL
jgi:hypothetical protein